MNRSVLPDFLRREDGAATIHGLYWLLGMLTVGAVAVDGANSWRVKNQVRAATDAAALAAAQKIDDIPAARLAATTVAGMNLDPELHGTVVKAQDVSFGHFDRDTGFFTLDEVAPTAVKVDGRRSEARGNPIRTALLGMVGQDAMDLSTFTIAEAIRPPVVASEPMHPCGNITILTKGFAEMVGNAELKGAACMHGGTGASASDNNLIADGAKVSAPHLDDIQITSLRAGSDDIDDIKTAAEMDPVILPELSELFVNTWLTLWDLPDGSSYQGPLIPATIADGGGAMTIRKIDDWWWHVKKQKQLDPNTIYLVNHGMKMNNGIDPQNVAFIVRGTLEMGGSGSDIERVYVLAENAISLRGSSRIGRTDYCGHGHFDSYLLSPTSVKWTGNPTINGVVTAAPVMDTAGALTVNGGLYLEAGNDIKLRGANDLTVCDTPLESHFPMAQPSAPVETEETASSGSVLRARILR